MPARRQSGTAGFVFHVLNRGVRRLRLFDAAGDYRAFLECVAEARARIPLRLLAYCVMPNHFHLVVWPSEDGQLAAFMHLMTGMHSKRWHKFRRTVGTGSVYQGRYKSFPVQRDTHFLMVSRYVERNALRADLVQRAEQWPWSSLAGHTRRLQIVELDDWPVPRPPDWLALVNQSDRAADLDRLRRSLRRGLPLGEQSWVLDTACRLGLEVSTHPRGRPLLKNDVGSLLRQTP